MNKQPTEGVRRDTGAPYYFVVKKSSLWGYRYEIQLRRKRRIGSERVDRTWTNRAERVVEHMLEMRYTNEKELREAGQETDVYGTYTYTTREKVK